MPNPFYYGGRVAPDQFVGRQAALKQIFGLLETAHTGQLQSVSVVGPHRMGRSSLLYYIACRYQHYLQNPNAYRVAYLSLHDAECKTPGGLLAKIARELKVNVRGGNEVTPAAFQKALEGLNQQHICPVVCLDEFEEMIRTGAFDNAFFDSWRHLMSNSVIAFVIASTRPLDELVQPDKYTSSFFNIFTVVELGELTESEAEQLVERGRQCDRPFNANDAKQMRMMGGRHAYQLQVAGEKIYQAKDGGKAVDWKLVRKQVERQYQQAGLSPIAAKWAERAWRWLLARLRGLGRAVLSVRRSDAEVSDETALWWGAGASLFFILLASGVSVFGINLLGLLAKLVKAWLGN